MKRNEKCSDITSPLLTASEACKWLKISKITLYRLTSEKKIPYLKIRGNLRFKLSSLEEYIDQQEIRG